jgi:presenilin-like A22 family membrane protease
VNLLNNTKFVIYSELIFSYILTFLLSIIVFLELNKLGLIVETIADPSSAWNSIYLFVNIIIATIVLILILKYVKRFPILKILEIFLVFISIGAFASFFIPDIMAMILAILIIIIKELTRNYLFKNLITSVIVGFISGYIAYSLEIFPIIILLILIAIYDFIAVFKTKHMVYLAKNIVNKNTVFIYDFGDVQDPVKATEENAKQIKAKGKEEKRDKMSLGTGDFALPLIAVVKFFFINPILGIISFILVILALILTISGLFKGHRALPAIPFQAFILALVYIFYILVF